MKDSESPDVLHPGASEPHRGAPLHGGAPHMEPHHCSNCGTATCPQCGAPTGAPHMSRKHARHAEHRAAAAAQRAAAAGGEAAGDDGPLRAAAPGGACAGALRGARRAFRRIHKGARTRLLILPALVICTSPLFISATIPVVMSVMQAQSINNVDGTGHTADLCITPAPAPGAPPAAASPTGEAPGADDGCAAYQQLLLSDPHSMEQSPLLAGPDAIFARGWFTDNPNNQEVVRVTLILGGAGRFAGHRSRQLRIDPAQTLRVSLGTLADNTEATISNGQPMPALSYDANLITETAELTYPRDKDFITVVLRVALETPGPNGSVTATAVPVVWQSTTNMALWQASLVKPITYGMVQEDLEGGAVHQRTLIMLTLRLERSSTVRSLVWLMFALSWIISAAMLALSLDITLFRPRPVESDDVAVAIGLLFALPAVRTSMPDAPPLGGPLDACGSIWNLGLVLIASLLLMAAWLGNVEN